MAITGSTDLGNGLLAITVDADPVAYPPEVPVGSLVIGPTGVLYRKEAAAVPAVTDSKNLGAVLQLIQFIDNGPATGFASGAYREMTGTVFPTAVVWYDKAGAGKKKIVEKLITWTGAFPTTIVWKLYDAADTLLATVTDVITYSGNFETSRLRTIA